MKFKDFLTEYGAALNPTDVQWRQQPMGMAQSFGDIARNSQANRQFQAGKQAIESLKYVIRSVWGNAAEYGPAVIRGSFPNAVIDVPRDKIVHTPHLGTSNPRQTISEIELNFYKQKGMVRDNGANLQIDVRKVYDYVSPPELMRTQAANAVDQVAQAATSSSSPNMQNWHYQG